MHVDIICCIPLADPAMSTEGTLKMFFSHQRISRKGPKASRGESIPVFQRTPKKPFVIFQRGTRTPVPISGSARGFIISICGSRKFFQRGLTLATFLVDYGIEVPNTTISGPSLAHH